MQRRTNSPVRVTRTILLLLLLYAPARPQEADSTPPPAPSAPAKRSVSVLPLSGSGIDAGLLAVLTDEFRKALAETGAFDVMSRDMMEEILQEQAFQLSDVCDQASCMVEAGRVIGVSHMIAATVTALSGSEYAVSVSMVDVQSSAVVASSSEQRSGGVYEAGRRMLANLATVLAGRPNEDHLVYVREQEKALAEQQRTELVQSRRWRVALSGYGYLPFDLFEPDAEEAKQAYFATDPDLKSRSVSDQGVEWGLALQGDYRLTKRLWVHLLVDYSRTKVHTSEVVKSQYVEFDMLLSGDTSLVYGNYDYTTRIGSFQRLGVIGVGLGVDFVRNARVRFGITVAPQIGFVAHHLVEQCSTVIDANVASYGIPTGKWQYSEQYTAEGVLSDVLLGVQAKLGTEFFVTRRLSVLADVAFDWRAAPSLEGTVESRVFAWERSSTDPSGVYYSYRDTERRAALRGDFLGTGEYTVITDPSIRQQQPNGVPVDCWRTYVEYADVRLALGMAFYF